MGRKSSRQKGKEHGSQWSFALRSSLLGLSGDYKKMYRGHIKRKRPKKRNKMTRQEYDDGFRIGFQKAEKRRGKK